MKFLGHAELEESIARLIQGRRLFCAVAFWGDGAAAHLGVPKADQNVRIICNLSMGGTNPKEIRRLQKAGLEVKQIDTLHAKVYIGQEEMLVTSANASSNGLGFDGRSAGHWIEAGASGPVQPEALRWFDDLWAASREISPADLDRAAKLWAVRQRFVPTLPSFAMFDPEAELVPLLDWYMDSEWIANEEVIALQMGQDRFTSQMERRLGDSIDVLGPADRAELSEGRWVLQWRRIKGARNTGKVGSAPLSWLQLGPFIERAYQEKSGAPWIDVMFPAETPGPVPFDATELLFREAFVTVLESKAFDELRAGDYDGEWNSAPRVRLLRPFWRAVKDRYLRLASSRVG